MADPVLHIKDSYYFEVPKLLYPYEYTRRQQFPDVWISLDPEFQEWEAERVYKELHALNADLPPQDKTLGDWHHWVHADHANFGKPLKEFFNEKYQAQLTKFQAWKKAQIAAAKAEKDKQKSKELVEHAKKLDFNQYLEHLQSGHTADQDYLPFLRWRQAHAMDYEHATQSDSVQNWKKEIQTWREDKSVTDWSEAKIHAYNTQLSGKILIPQPFGTLRNLYEAETTIIDQRTGGINYHNFGFCFSKYMVIELFIGLVVVILFSRLAARIERGVPPKGKLWNLLEVFLVFIRDQVARPSLGGHHEEDHDHPEHGHEYGGPYAEHGQATNGHGHRRAEEKTRAAAGGHAYHAHPADRFLPLLWTVFFFVLGCNLMGMVPWAGTPTAAFAVTLAMAAVAFFAVVASGMAQFGVAGFFLNQIPGMDLPWYMAMVIKPMILVIELLGLCIKHGVLAVRLLANMVAGHLVLLAIMGFAFSAEAALAFAAPGSTWQWAIVGVISLLASTALSCLELFVAFLQAYIFTFLTALFIGAAIHKH